MLSDEEELPAVTDSDEEKSVSHTEHNTVLGVFPIVLVWCVVSLSGRLVSQLVCLDW